MKRLPKRLMLRRLDTTFLCSACTQNVEEAKNRGKEYYPTQRLCRPCQDRFEERYAIPEGRAEVNMAFRRLYALYKQGVPVPEIAKQLRVTRQWVYAQLKDAGIYAETPVGKAHKTRAGWYKISPYTYGPEGIKKQLLDWLVEEKSWSWIERAVPRTLFAPVAAVAQELGLTPEVYRYRALSYAYLDKPENVSLKEYLVGLCQNNPSLAAAAQELGVSPATFMTGMRAIGFDTEDFWPKQTKDELDAHLAEIRGKALEWRREKKAWEKANRPYELNPVSITRYIEKRLKAGAEPWEVRDELSFNNPPRWLEDLIKDWVA